jgi:hypothetical protein
VRASEIPERAIFSLDPLIPGREVLVAVIRLSSWTRSCPQIGRGSFMQTKVVMTMLIPMRKSESPELIATISSHEIFSKK